MDARTQNLIEECKRQEESCLYTSTTLFEWLKSMRRYRVLFVVAPIILGGIAAWPIFKQQPGCEWLTGLCALLAGITPAIYKALNLDVEQPHQRVAPMAMQQNQPPPQGLDAQTNVGLHQQKVAQLFLWRFPAAPGGCG